MLTGLPAALSAPLAIEPHHQEVPDVLLHLAGTSHVTQLDDCTQSRS